MTVPPVLQLLGDRLLTWEDLQSVPDGAHHRYQLIEGQILISPTPGLAHQRCVGRLYTRLTASAPSAVEVILGPFPFVPEPGTSLQPDLLVVPRGVVGAQLTTQPPLLVVEVMSPSSRAIDRGAKRELYARTGVGHYWLVDPDDPSIMAFELDVDGSYPDASRVRRGGVFAVDVPFPVEFSPAELIGG